MTLSVDDYIAKRGLSKEAIAEKGRELQDRIEAYEFPNASNRERELFARSNNEHH